MGAFERMLPDTAATEAFGAELGGILRPGDAVILAGELGAGKTALTRGIGAALGAEGAVSSPTFVIARTHRTARGMPLVHVDAYRLVSSSELDDLDIDFPASITVIEWGRGLAEPVLDAWLDLELTRPKGGALDPEADPDEPRRLVAIPHGGDWAERLSTLTP
ncbi:MAG: tRNA (adenosine(37)-N6)-threonylcarbamoyltransferase complex ATPase subunit type 1 TsaE [Micrococcales bacterium]|nr:tRNA (adenosine(37)-N6)-threonylcarbamoyltransferase complex ATPase subunit type 1 TsaE [Micrococcales bacterium]